jgi:pimeloyl-ACP methyl ester carboxylesterase
MVPSATLQHRFEHGMFVRDREATDVRGTVLFVHGLGESGLCFEHLLDHPGLAGWRLLVPDLPGYGRSPWLSEPLGLAAQADHLAAWLRECHCMQGIAPVVVAGHSMGGVSGLLFCERHPELASALIDIDGNVCGDDCVFSGQAAAHSLAEFSAEGFDRLRKAVHRMGRDDPAHRGYYVSMRLADPRTYHLNSCELLAMSEQGDIAERLRNLPVPVHYIAGAPGGASARTRSILAASGLSWVAIEPSGHWPFLDQPDRFVDVLNQFLSGTGPGQ